MAPKKNNTASKKMIAKKTPSKQKQQQQISETKEDKIVIVNIHHDHRHHAMMSFFWTLLTIYAIYLSFERNKGFNILSFFFALFFAPVYIVYAWAVPVQEGYYDSIIANFFYGLISFIIWVISIILWFQRNSMRTTFWGQLGSFIVAWFFAPIYIIHAMIAPKPKPVSVKQIQMVQFKKKP